MPDAGREAGLLRSQPGARVATPLCRLAQEMAGLQGWRRHALAFLLGVAAAAAMPPVDLVPLLVPAFTGLLWLEDGVRGPWASFRLGWSFGFGFFLAGMYWVAAALLVDIDDFWWLVPFAAAGLPAVLALYCGTALAATRLAADRLRLAGWARIFAFAVAWAAAEWLRGHLFTGLPWNLIGYAWSGGFPGSIAPLQTTAWVGIYGLSLVTVAAAALPALLGSLSLTPLSAARRWAPALAAGLLIALPAAFGAARLRSSPTALTSVWLRIVQPSIPQTLKWDPSAAQSNFTRLVGLSAAPSAHPLAALIWPEAAVPFLMSRDPAHRRALAGVAPTHGYLLTGALRADPPPGPVTRIWNSLEAVDSRGRILAHYDKAHLVPFGEYVPFRGLLPIDKITPGTMDLSAGPGPRTLHLPGLPAFAPMICYEAIFPHAIVDEGERPEWLLNITNDAWYGRSSGPFQHFSIARTRAVEEGLPLVRVANNGISGEIDPEGRVLARLNLDAVGYADIPLAADRGPTLYAQAGDWTFLALLCLFALPAAFRRR
jgi:apolipoprotein N-acyltransferase